jgi:hypothetical protein
MKQQNADLVNPSWNIYFQICLCIKVEVADSHRSGSFIKVTGITMATRQLEFPHGVVQEEDAEIDPVTKQAGQRTSPSSCSTGFRKPPHS